MGQTAGVKEVWRTVEISGKQKGRSGPSNALKNQTPVHYQGVSMYPSLSYPPPPFASAGSLLPSPAV